MACGSFGMHISTGLLRDLMLHSESKRASGSGLIDWWMALTLSNGITVDLIIKRAVDDV